MKWNWLEDETTMKATLYKTITKCSIYIPSDNPIDKNKLNDIKITSKNINFNGWL